MRRFSVLVFAVVLVLAITETLASASERAAHKSGIPKASTAFPWLPAGVTAAGNDFAYSGGDMSNTRYSTLTQIDTKNVSKLHQVWQNVYTGYNQNPETFEARPIVVSGKNKNLPLDSGTMFFPTNVGLVALDPVSGKALWTYSGPATNTKSTNPTAVVHTPRSEAYANGMVFVGQQDGSVVALNSKTGAAIWTVDVTAVGTSGQISTGQESAPYVQYYDNGKDGLVIAGVNGGDSPLRGHLDAYDGKTGALVWRTWMTPDPTQLPFILTWGNPANAAYGGSALWSNASIDPQLQMVYFGTGNAYPEVGRAPGKDLWSDAEMAVNINTGQLKWYFQQVHHDEWDYDVPNPPNRFNAMIDGKLTPVLAVGGKTGYMYVRNALNGRPVPHFATPEVPVPDLNSGKGAALDLTWPTQPEPQGGSGEIVRTCYTPALMQEKFPTAYPTAPNGTPMVPTCMFAPPYNDAYLTWGSIGSGGGIGWPPTSYDPQTNDLYICAQVQAAGHETLAPNNPVQQSISVGSDTTGLGTPGWAGSVAALNMGTNKIDWLVKYQRAPDGDCYSGTLSTAGGLVFVASRADESVADPLNNLPAGTTFGGFLYAYDAKTGKQLWSWQAQDLIQAPATTYSINGKQYLAWLVMGHQGNVRDARLTVFSL
jgi:quinohemoprotein ethanol dehydrogenase